MSNDVDLIQGPQFENQQSRETSMEGEELGSSALIHQVLQSLSA